ncbi:hypothetical protein OEZ86_005813 [Tetradesmus obliquus]|nr:hypothetical protein OEZ86_005813 [Tetradesmus obliquus]
MDRGDRRSHQTSSTAENANVPAEGRADQAERLPRRRTSASKARVAQWLGLASTQAIAAGTEAPAADASTVYSVTPSVLGAQPLTQQRLPGSLCSGPIPAKGRWHQEQEEEELQQSASPSVAGSHADNSFADARPAAAAAPNVINNTEPQQDGLMRGVAQEEPWAAAARTAAAGNAAADIPGNSGRHRAAGVLSPQSSFGSSIAAASSVVAGYAAAGTAAAAAAAAVPRKPPPALAMTRGSERPLLLAGRPLYAENHYLLRDVQRHVLLAADGSVMQLADPATNPKPYQGLVPEPHITSNTGHPYHATHKGVLHPLALAANGRPLKACDGRPLLLGTPQQQQQQQQPGQLLAATAARLGLQADGSISSKVPSVVVWPLLTCSGKGSPLLGPAGEHLGLAAVPQDFPYLKAPGQQQTAAAAAGAAARLPAVSGQPTLVNALTGEALLAADRSKLGLGPDGGFDSLGTGRRVWGSDGRPLNPTSRGKTLADRALEVAAQLQAAAAKGRLKRHVRQMIKRYRRQGQEHLLQQAGLVAAAALGAAAFAGLLLLLPVCWIGLAGPAGYLTIKLLLLLLPLLVLGCLAALLLLALQHGQISTDSLLDLITPPTQQLPPHPILIKAGGEPLLLPDHRPLGVIPVTPAPGVLDGQGASGFMLVAGGRQLKGKDRMPLRLVLGGASGNVLLDEDGLPMLGPGGRPLEVLLGPNNSPLTSGTGLPLALSPEGALLLGPDGSPLSLAPDDEALLGWAGLPLLGPQGQALALGPNCTLLTADGRPLVGRDGDFLFLGKDGKSLVDRDGRPALGADGRPSQVSLAKSRPVFSARGKLLVGPDSRPLLMGYGGRLYSSSTAAAAGEGGTANAAGLTNATALMAGAAARSLHRIGSSNIGTLLRTLSAGHLGNLAAVVGGGPSRTNSLTGITGSFTLQRTPSSQGVLDRAALAGGSSASLPGGLRTVSEDQAVQDLTAAAAAAVARGAADSESSSSSSSEGAVGERVEAAVKAAAALLGLGGLLPLLGPQGEPLALDAYGRLVTVPGRAPLTGPSGQPLQLSVDGKCFTGPDGRPVLTSSGRPLTPSIGVVARPAVGRDGRLLLGPDGSALRLGADKAKLLTASGRPLLSPSGAALGLSPAGNLIELDTGAMLVSS